MKKSPILSLLLLLFHFSSFAQFEKVTTIEGQCYYLTDFGNTTYLVAVKKSPDSIKAYQPVALNSPIYAFKPYLPTGYELDSVFMLGFEVLNNLDFGFAYTVKNQFGESKGIICNSEGDLKWQEDDVVAFKSVQTTGFFKISFVKSSLGKMTTHIIDMTQKEEAVYPTGELGMGVVNPIGGKAYYRFYYVDLNNLQLVVHGFDHELLDKISIAKPADFTLLPQSTLFPNGEVTATGTNFGVYFQKQGVEKEFSARIINKAGVVQTFNNSQELDLQERNNGSIINSRIELNGKDVWQVYTLNPSSGNTNTATYSFNLRSKLIYENRFSQSAFGIPTNDFVVDFYDVFLNTREEWRVPLDLQNDDDLISWRAFHDGGSNGSNKDQEVYYLWKNEKTKAYTFKVSNSEEQDLMERKDATSFHLHPDEVEDKTQLILNVPNVGAEVYEYDFSISQFKQISPKNNAVELDHKKLTLTWESAGKAETYSLYIMEDTANFKGYRAFGQLTDTFYTFENQLDSGVTYYWNVAASNSGAFVRQKSYFKFTTLDPSALTVPILLSPSNNEQNVSYNHLTLVWSMVTNAESYTYQLSKSATFDNYLAGDPTDTFFKLTNLSKNTPYYWRVRANKEGAIGDWSATSTFTTALVDNVNELEKFGLSIYPNPAHGHFVMSVELSENLPYQIFSSNGRQIEVGILKPKQAVQLDVNKWTSGVYEIRFENNGDVIRHKLIVF